MPWSGRTERAMGSSQDPVREERSNEEDAPSGDARTPASKKGPATEEEDGDKGCSRLAMTLREAEIIAKNLKESGTRR